MGGGGGGGGGGGFPYANSVIAFVESLVVFREMLRV